MTSAPMPFMERQRTAEYLAEMLGQLRGLAQSARFYDLAYLTALAEAEAKLQCAEKKPQDHHRE